MIPEHSVDGHDFHVFDLRRIEDSVRCVCARHIRRGLIFGPFAKGAFHAHLSPQAEQHWDDEKDEVLGHHGRYRVVSGMNSGRKDNANSALFKSAPSEKRGFGFRAEFSISSGSDCDPARSAAEDRNPANRPGSSASFPQESDFIVEPDRFRCRGR
jgi:hypothetical protein